MVVFPERKAIVPINVFPSLVIYLIVLSYAPKVSIR